VEAVCGCRQPAQRFEGDDIGARVGALCLSVAELLDLQMPATPPFYATTGKHRMPVALHDGFTVSH
jgi:hypothetical protein